MNIVNVKTMAFNVGAITNGFPTWTVLPDDETLLRFVRAIADECATLIENDGWRTEEQLVREIRNLFKDNHV